MPDFKSHRPGSVCYVELVTNDTNVAQKFYSSLFGWTVKEEDMGPHGVYSQYYQDDKVTAAMYKLMPEQESQGVPPHWGTYFAVENCDVTTDLARELGAKVVAGPMDVADYGRMSVISDPDGATFCIWQVNTKIGIEVRDQVNTVCWSELMTTDPAAAQQFYGRLFSWETKDMGKGDMEGTYHHMGFAEEGPLVGVMRIEEAMGPVPPHWSNYFQVEDCQAAEKQALKLGGKSIVPTTPIPAMGFFCVLSDPTGAVFGLFHSLNS